jgi:hypothetical protein
MVSDDLAIGDDTGWMIGGGFFLVFSLAIGWAAYAVSSRFLAMRSLDQSVPSTRRGSVVLGVIIGGGVLVMLAMTSLSEFAKLMIQNGALTMQYRWTGQAVILPFTEVMSIQEEPAFKGRWRLVVVTDTNGTYESALSSQADVHRTAEILRRQILQPYAAEQ